MFLIHFSIKGGSYWTQPVNTDLILDASKSYDPDNTNSVLNYMWTCVTDTGSVCTDSSQQVITFSSQAVQTVRANTLQQNITQIYTCVVSSGSKGTTVSATIHTVESTVSFIAER